jgi:preprotein translocase SecE subunit
MSEETKSKTKIKKKFILLTGLNNLVIEYKKIVWLDFKSLLKQTYVVIATCFLFGIIIFLMDIAYGYSTDYLIRYLSKL